MIRPILAAAVSALALAACATPTVYAPEGYGGQRGGFAEQRLQADRFAVTFSGNSLTSRDTVEMYLLYRAAELTLENGYDWFLTDYRATEVENRYYSSPDPWYGGGYGRYWGPSWRYYRRSAWSPWNDPWGDPFGRGGWDVREVSRYEARAEIVLGRGQTPSDGHAFNAREIIENLGPRVARPGAYAGY